MNKLRILFVYFKTKYFNVFFNRKELVKFQRKSLIKFSYFLYDNSLYYLRYKNKTKEVLDLPIINKKIFIDNFDLINTKNIKKEEALKVALEAENSRDFRSQINDISIGLSSGTSGNKGIFLASKKEREIWAGYILAKAGINIFKKNKIAFFLRANNNLYSTVKSKNLQFRFYDLFKKFNLHIHSLNEYNPNILIAPASVLVILAKAKLNEELIISPTKIYSVAEVLEPQDKKFISNVFNVQVGQIYQCTEGFLGITCKYGTLHINEDILVMQKTYVDIEKKKFKPIITDFTRSSQPVIRYELDDILTEKKEKCNCGSSLLPIESIEGRIDDIIYLKNYFNELIPIFPDYFRRLIITSSDFIEDYYVEQVKESIVKIYIDVKLDKKAIKRKVKLNINSFLEKRNIILPKIIFISNKPIFKKGDKKRRVRSLLKS